MGDDVNKQENSGTNVKVKATCHFLQRHLYYCHAYSCTGLGVSQVPKLCQRDRSTPDLFDRNLYAIYTATTSIMTSERWTHKQHALLLNYVDACLLDNMNYTDTVQQALLNATGREATLSAIMYRLRQYVKLCNPPMVVKDFLSRGTHSLDKGAISEDLLNTMRQQRSPRLHDLQLRDSPKFNATLDAESRLSGVSPLDLLYELTKLRNHIGEREKTSQRAKVIS